MERASAALAAILLVLPAACATPPPVASERPAPAPPPARIVALAPDLDHDGVPDADDACPDQPETVNDCKDQDGCPDEWRVVRGTRSTRLEFLDNLTFRRGSAAVRPQDHVILDGTAAAMRQPSHLVVEVEGHSGRDERNATALSRARADSAVGALVARGVGPERLRAVGRPAGDAGCRERPSECHARARRVEFKIVEGTAPPPSPEGDGKGRSCTKVLL